MKIGWVPFYIIFCGLLLPKISSNIEITPKVDGNYPLLPPASEKTFGSVRTSPQVAFARWIAGFVSYIAYLRELSNTNSDSARIPLIARAHGWQIGRASCRERV